MDIRSLIYIIIENKVLYIVIFEPSNSERVVLMGIIMIDDFIKFL